MGVTVNVPAEINDSPNPATGMDGGSCPSVHTSLPIWKTEPIQAPLPRWLFLLLFDLKLQFPELPGPFTFLAKSSTAEKLGMGSVFCLQLGPVWLPTAVLLGGLLFPNLSPEPACKYIQRIPAQKRIISRRETRPWVPQG